MNKENILKVADAIENETIKGLKFRMDKILYNKEFEDTSNDLLVAERKFTCGTAGCIAGWAYVIYTLEFRGKMPVTIPDGEFMLQRARHFLNLSRTDAAHLFLTHVDMNELETVKAEDAVWVLRNLVEKTVIDWTIDGLYTKMHWQNVYYLDHDLV